MSEMEFPVGVFDSGLGGLTVVRSIMELLPEESITYLGDTARVPYGTRSPETVAKYAAQCAQLLVDRGIKILVVACNTASAHGLESLRAELPIPVLGVVDPGARAASVVTRNGRIGVVGTRGTISSGEYQRALQNYAPEADIYCECCPLFVPMAEEGMLHGPIADEICRMYLSPILSQNVDTLLLGCTHYPLLEKTIRTVAGTDVQIVDSAHATAESLRDVLSSSGLAAEGGNVKHSFLVTDSPSTFHDSGAAFLGKPLGDIEWVDL